MISSEINSKPKLNLNLVAIAALCLALFGIALASIFIVIAREEIGPNAITFYRLAIAAVTFSLWNRFNPSNTTQAQQSYSKKDIILLITAGASFAASLSVWSWSLTETSVTNSTLLNNTVPIFTTLGAWFIFGQRFNRQFIVGMLVAIVGAIALALEDLHIAPSNLLGDSAALLAAILFVVCILTIEKLRLKFATTVVMMWATLVGSIIIFPMAMIFDGYMFPTSLEVWLAVIFLAIASQVMGHGLLTYSLKQFSASFVSVSMLAIPVIAAILATIIFEEQLTLTNCLAFSVVLVGIYVSVSAEEQK